MSNGEDNHLRPLHVLEAAVCGFSTAQYRLHTGVAQTKASASEQSSNRRTPVALSDVQSGD